MSIERMLNLTSPKSSHKRQRKSAIALVIFTGLALSLMPLRALCELRLANAAHVMGEHGTEHPTGHGEERSDLCCSSIDGALVNSAAPDLSGGPGAAPFAVPLFPARVLFGSVVHRLPLAGAPPPSRSYYARSSRILR
jgi:hypothetical protein